MANVFKAVIRTFVDVRYCEDKCCRVLFWSSIEIVMQSSVPNDEPSSLIYYRLATILFACVQTLHEEALPPSRSVHHYSSKDATFKKSAESHVSINMAVVLRTKIYLICRRPDGLTAVHGSLKWY